jgi:hypothetical protein
VFNPIVVHHHHQKIVSQVGLLNAFEEDSMSVLQRARDSGKCPPSLLSEERVIDEDGFDDAVLKVLDATGKKDSQRCCACCASIPGFSLTNCFCQSFFTMPAFVLAPDLQTADDFATLLQVRD